MKPKKVCRVFLLFSLALLFAATAMAQNKVVVIPLMEDAPPAGPPVPMPKTGQTDCYYDNGTTGICTCDTTNCPFGQDGDLEKGKPWPNPRFTDNNNGTVTDHLTGLIWLQVGNCSTFFEDDPASFAWRKWNEAVDDCNKLAPPYCGLDDGSEAGHWRLPNVRELQSLIDYGKSNLALPTGHQLTDTQTANYWSASTYVNISDLAWATSFSSGEVRGYGKTSYGYYVRCVR